MLSSSHINTVIGMMQKYNLRLSDEEYKNFKKASVQIERSINELIREAIRDWLVKTSN